MEGMVEDGEGNEAGRDSDPLGTSSPSNEGVGAGGDGPQNGNHPGFVHVSNASRRLNTVQVQSVIQPTQPSVIQTAPALQAVQLATSLKGQNVILLNKGGSVIHATASGIQVVETNGDDDPLNDDATRKRREILARRPSYRKILNDLGSAEVNVQKNSDSPSASESSQDSETVTITTAGNTLSITGQHYQTTGGLLKVIPASAIQIASGNSAASEGLHTLVTTGSTGGAIVQYAQSQEGQYFVPVTVASGEIQGYRIQTVPTTTSLGQGLMVTQGEHIMEEASRKREIRLMKNRFL